MKRNIIYTLGCTAALFFTWGCGQDNPDAVTPDGKILPLAFSIGDTGYQDSRLSRATENGYKTVFTDGDECGMYIVRNGEVVADNVKLTAVEHEGAVTWLPDRALVGGQDGESYHLYYPYQADMTDKFRVNESDFFAPLVSNWEVKEDQSDGGYTASDLMTSNSSTAVTENGKLRISFSMIHRMALAVIDIPSEVRMYVSTGSGIEINIIPVEPKSADFSGGALKPYGMDDGTYRYLLRPMTTPPDDKAIKGRYAQPESGGPYQREFTVIPSDIAAGTYKVYVSVEDGPIQKVQAAQE